MPDELIVSILSFMTLKEAVRTSVLSHRWKQLWPFFTGSLDFDDPDTFWAIADRKKKMKGERRKFVKRVNHVLKLHQGSNIDQFRVCFEFDNHHKHPLMDGLTLQSQSELRGLNWTLHQQRHAKNKCFIHFHMNGLLASKVLWLEYLASSP